MKTTPAPADDSLIRQAAFHHVQRNRSINPTLPRFS